MSGTDGICGVMIAGCFWVRDVFTFRGVSLGKPGIVGFSVMAILASSEQCPYQR